MRRQRATALLIDLGAVLAAPADGRDRALAVPREQQANRGKAVAEVLDFVREVRAAGLPVGMAVDTTDGLDTDLAALGLAGEFDVVANSSRLGGCKPAKEYFHRACHLLGAPPDRVLLVDDSDRVVRGARVAGLSAYRWNGPADLPYLRSALGLPNPEPIEPPDRELSGGRP